LFSSFYYLRFYFLFDQREALGLLRSDVRRSRVMRALRVMLAFGK